MAEDYSISAKITADTSGFEKGIDKAQKASKNLSKSVSGVIQGLGKSGLVGALGAVGLASAGVSAVLGTVAKVAKKVAQTIDECSQAYRKQYQAEIALSTAVNNNPYVDGTATKRLKEFASEMQKVSDVGDEQMLPMMADLIAKGRTEEETMQIMKVALDMSAGGAMSLETAITQLNATLNGNVGRLGQQNAELKDLTEEELKQGKAVEILGEKYKGLSKATADSQKQLKNAVGDLKENMGQIFEQALAPMRNFFTEVITNLNNSITKSRELKSSMKEVFGDEGDVNLGASTDALNTAFTEILHKQQEVSKNYRQYIQLYGKYIDVSTDETALSYQNQITTLENQLKEISEELNKRRRESEEEKKRLAQARADEEAEKELEKQKELREKELVLENEWADKLFAIRLENLEKAREKELENEKLTQKEREAIVDFYGEQILAMKIKQLEKEREEALKQENLTEDSTRSINLYYENKITNAKKDEEEKRLKLKKNTIKEEEKEDKRYFTEYIKMAISATKKVSEAIKNVAKKIASTIKSVISGIGNIFGKAFDIFNFNPDDALVSLLKIEDSILTFFVETLPKLPSFFASAIQSIVVLLDNLLSNIDWASIKKMLNTIIDIIINNAPSIASNVLKVVINIAQTLLNGLMHFLKSGGWKILMDFLLELQQAVEEFVIDNIDELADMIADMMPALVNMLVKSIVSASKTLGKIIKPVLKIIGTLIEAILKVITSNEVINASINAISQVVEAIVSFIIGNLGPILINITSAIIQNLPQILPSLITAIVSGISNGVSTGFINSFKNVKWGDLLKGFGDVLKKIAEDFLGIITGGVSKVVTGSGNGKGSTTERVIKGLLTGGLSEVFGWASGTNNAPAGLSIVGEAGPELVKFRGGEQVLNNRNTNKALESMGKENNTFNVTFNNLQDTTAFAMMSQLKAYNRQMAINGIM